MLLLYCVCDIFFYRLFWFAVLFIPHRKGCFYFFLGIPFSTNIYWYKCKHKRFCIDSKTRSWFIFIIPRYRKSDNQKHFLQFDRVRSLLFKTIFFSKPQFSFLRENFFFKYTNWWILLYNIWWCFWTELRKLTADWTAF